MVDPANPDLAGVVGSILSLRWAPGPSWADRLFSVAGGLCVAYFVAPYVMEQMRVTSPRGLVAAGFLFGLVGANLIAKFVAYVKAADPGLLFRRKP